MKYLFIFILITGLVSCRAGMELHGESKPETITFSFNVDSAKFDSSELRQIAFNVQQFEEEFNLEQHEFKVKFTENDSADLTFNFQKTRRWTVGKAVLSGVITYSASIWLRFGPWYAFYLAPAFMNIQGDDATFVKVSLSDQLSHNKKPLKVAFGSSPKFKKKRMERRMHFRHLDANLAEFFDQLEKELIEEISNREKKGN